MDDMNINYAQTRVRVQRSVITSCEEVYRNEFSKIISSSFELHTFLNMLALDIKIIEDQVGLQRVKRMLGIFHNPFSDLASRILNLGWLDNYRFCNITYPLGLIVRPDLDDENDCVLLQVITRADEDDEFRDKFLSLVACNTHSLSMDDEGISLIKHVLNLEFTRKTTQEDVLLHALMAEFDKVRIFDEAELPRLASKLTSDPDLFVKFFKTRRGLMLQILLGKSVEFDTMLFEAFKQRFTDVTTHIYGYDIVWQIIKVFSERGNLEVYDEIGRLMGEHALHLAKDPYHGHIILKKVIDSRNLDRTIYIACVLEGHYIELSFLKHGSSVVETLLDEVEELSLKIIFMEIVKCDEDRLVRLAKDEYGNVVLKKTLELTKALGLDLFDDLVEKLMPILDSLLGTRGENIVALIIVT